MSPPASVRAALHSIIGRVGAVAQRFDIVAEMAMSIILQRFNHRLHSAQQRKRYGPLCHAPKLLNVQLVQDTTGAGVFGVRDRPRPPRPLRFRRQRRPAFVDRRRPASPGSTRSSGCCRRCRESADRPCRDRCRCRSAATVVTPMRWASLTAMSSRCGSTMTMASGSRFISRMPCRLRLILVHSRMSCETIFLE